MRTTHLTRGGAIALLIAVTTPLAAQPVTKDVRRSASLDRTVQPKAGPQATLRVPTWTKTKLANGAELIVAEKHDLPLVSFSISFVGGTANYEAPEKVGVGAFTASMLSEGTASMTGEQLSDAQQLLGTSIGVGVGSESGSIAFTSLKDKFAPALTLVADMLTNSTFPAEALERLRGRSLVGLTQARDNPNAIASNVFAKVVYGDAHPYGRVLTESSVKAITRDDVIAFSKAYFQPGRAVITVSGDVDPATARSEVEKAFAKWPAGGSRPTFAYPQPPALKPRTIYLVDKPKAAQSVFALGIPGPTRATPDYYAIQVMNMVLGGLFQSRINHNIREVKGYSYGVNSSFGYGRGPGAFRAGGGIVTDKSDSALVEFMKELRGARGDVPFTDDEIEQGKAALIQSLPQRFSSVNAMAGSIASIYTQDLPESYFRDYAAKVNAITRDDLVRVAQKYVDLDHLNIVIVGDRSVIEAPLKASGIAPIVVLDLDAKPVVVP
jgi:zinc protease